MRASSTEKDAQCIAELEANIASEGGYFAETQTAKILAGLGLPQEKIKGSKITQGDLRNT